jgi:pyruvate dehydrogenase E2 component (dihydrolipoyllysine-residue acetyltransferase)
MISKVVLAKLSPTMDEGTIVKWSKREGDKVKVGDILAEIETDKANMEMEALGQGVLRKILVPEGGRAPVGALIGVIAEPGEDIAPLLAEAAAAPPPAPAAAPTPAPAQPAVAPPAVRPAPATPPVAPPRAPAAVVPFTGAAASSAGGRVKASPLARAMAARGNVPLASVPGSGPGGRIVKRDVEGYLSAPRAAAPAARAKAAPLPSVAPGTVIPLSGMRRTIARRLAESAFSAPHFYVTVEIDMDAAVSLREQLVRAEEIKVSYNDLVVKACAKALTRFPTVNASWTGEAIATHAEVHVGVAVSIPDGLITPVVRDADRKHLLEISAEIRDLAARARDRKLKPEEFTGSTFTVSNLGMFDVEEFTAIINPPESCILAVGAVRKLPVVVDDRVTVGHRMKVTLSSDHRAVDGALAAQFLAEVRRLLESPVSLLV